MMGAGVTMTALINDEGAAEMGDIEFIGAQKIKKVDFAAFSASSTMPATSRPPAPGKKPISSAATRDGGGVKNIETVPAAFSVGAGRPDHAAIAGNLRCQRQHRRTIGADQGAGAQNNHRALGVP